MNGWRVPKSALSQDIGWGGCGQARVQNGYFTREKRDMIVKKEKYNCKWKIRCVPGLVAQKYSEP